MFEIRIRIILLCLPSILFATTLDIGKIWCVLLNLFEHGLNFKLNGLGKCETVCMIK